VKKNKLLCKAGDYPPFPFFLAFLSTPPHLSPPNSKIDPQGPVGCGLKIVSTKNKS